MRLSCLVLLAACTQALVPPLSAKPAARQLAAEPKAKGKKEDMSAWDIYTDGEYGQAFKFPWEAVATDKTTIGHIIPVVATIGIIGYARLTHG